MFDRLRRAPRRVAALALAFALASSLFVPAPRAQEASPLIGQPPPLPLSAPQRMRLRDDPAALAGMGSMLPPVASRPAPPPPAASPWRLGSQPAGAPILSNPLLMTDGTVLAHVSCTRTWWKLTPDITGSYVNGTWSQIASLPVGYGPRFFSSAVLPDGKVIIEGGEYNETYSDCNTGIWTDLGAIYDPASDKWTAVKPPNGWAQIGDSQAIVLTNGVYFQADCCDAGPLAALFNETTRTWKSTGAGKFDIYDEEGWTLLPNGEVLTVDAYVFTSTCGTNTEVYSPSTHTWTSAGHTPVPLADCANPAHQPSYEMGPQVLRPNGTVVALGGTLCADAGTTDCRNGTDKVVTPTAVYDTSTKSWSAGANIPAVGGQNYSLADAPAALLPDGNVLFAASPNYQGFVPPTHFFEYGLGNHIVQAADPTDNASFTGFEWNFLVLPTGQVMALETDGSNVWYYNSSGMPQPSWSPVVTSVPESLVAGGTYQLSGRQLNGLSQGAAYGDDVQAATNYPIIEIVNDATGHVFFARIFGPSTMSVAPHTAVTVNFTVPDTIEAGPSRLYAIANGISSVGTPVMAARGLYAKPADFNGDRKSDLLWRNSNGTVEIWEMNGGKVLSKATVKEQFNDWSIVGVGDFNGDGKSDILWRNIDGAVQIWELNGAKIVASLVNRVVSNNWTIVGTGDFNGDGKSDILWRNAINGTVMLWEMNGGTTLHSYQWSLADNWNIVGIGDFFGTGKSGILLRSTDGTLQIWRIVDGSVVTNTVNQTVPAIWTIVGTGDFNGDRKSDILMRNTSGTVLIWEMNGASLLAKVLNQPLSNNWVFAGIGDYNGDGKSDILWRNIDGEAQIWEMSGGTVLAKVLNQNVPTPEWTLIQ
jgi:hypothetical protein